MWRPIACEKEGKNARCARWPNPHFDGGSKIFHVLAVTVTITITITTTTTGLGSRRCDAARRGA